MILITGTTGLVGTHLLAKLVENTNPKQIRALFRTMQKKEFCIATINRIYGNKTAELTKQVDWVVADINAIPELEKSFRDVDFVYHCAGLISNNPSERKLLRKINIEGTANVVNLAIEYRVKKLCHVSSIATLGRKKGEKSYIDEETYRENLNNSSYYSIAKYGGEMEVWRATQEGLDVVIVNPGVIIGEGFYTSGSGEIFKQVKNKFPFQIKKTTGFVGVVDVVNIMLICMNSQIKNERFIVVENNYVFNDIVKQIANQLEIKPPRFKLQQWMLYLYWLFEIVASRISNYKRKLSLDLIPTLLENNAYSNQKISEKLGYTFTPMSEVISKCVADFNTITQKNI